MDANPSRAESVPRLVGRYSLVSRVVSGGLGALFRAKIASGPEAGRHVLVRLVERTTAFDGKAVERLTNAGFAAMELRHAKIAAVLDVAVGDAEIAVVSEHIGGAVLQLLLRQTGPKRAPATPALALRVVADVLEALDAVRAPWGEITADPSTEDEIVLARGLHGGLMPDDLLVATFGETMLLEAGLAGTAMTLPAVLEHPEVVAYRAPEQLEPKGQVDERADVFTAGILAWELIAGRSLFGPMMLPRPPVAAAPGKPKPLSDAAQASAVRRKVLSAPVQGLDSLPLLRGKVTKEAASWVARCLERDPARRFSTLRDALSELKGLPSGVLATSEAVAKWIASSGVELELEAEPSPAESSRSSNRPTPPPETRRGVVENADAAPKEAPGTPALAPQKATTPMGVTSPVLAGSVPLAAEGSGGITPSFDGTTVKVTAASVESDSRDFGSIPPSTDVESIPPSGDFGSIPPSTDVESIPPSTDVESIPPSTDVESIPPRSDGFVLGAESVPPSSADAVTLPPAAPAPTAVGGLGRLASTGEEQTSAPVVSPIASLTDDDRSDEAPTFAPRARQVGARKVVVGVMAAAGLLAVAGILRVLLLRHAEHAGDSAGVAGVSSAAPGAPKPDSLARPEAPVAPSPAASARGAPLPTSAPSSSNVSDSNPFSGAPADALKRPVGAGANTATRKKPYRPTGI